MTTISCKLEDKEFVNSIYKEIFEEHEYAQYGVQVEEGDTVVDLGAHVGLFTLYALEQGAQKVIAYECDSGNFSHLQSNTNDVRVQSVLGYIGYTNVTLSDVINNNQLDKIDFLKMDIEGFEWDLLDNCPDEVFAKVDKWVIEFHTSHNNQNISWEEKFKTLFRLLNIIERFNKHGYTVYYEHRHKPWDIVMLYVKRS